MKYFTLIFLILVFTKLVNSQTKHAIIVAIADYPTNEKGETVWKDLSSNNDVELVKAMLKEQQFPESNCTYLIDKEATPENLDKAFESLIVKLKEGDIVYFHYSGHGQQVADIKPKKRKGLVGGDERDGYDEAFALYNAPMKFDKKGEYEMEHHYVDDQMKVHFDNIRKKIGPKGQVVLIIDACHSGTSTRGTDDPSVRGSIEVCAPANWKPNTEKDSSEAFGTDFNYEMNQPMGKMVAFFGCKAEQVNNEYKPEGSETRYGSLTYFLIQGMKNLGENASYANLFSEVRKNMLVSFNGKQIPEIEGDDLNQAIFSNSFIPTKPFFNVESIYFNEINLDAGSLSGLSIGDEIGLFGTEVNNPKDAKALFEGKITELSVKKATIQLTNGIEDSKSNIGLYRAFILKKGSTGAEIKVKLELKKHKKEMETRLELLSNIQLVKTDYNFLVKEIDGGKVIIYVGMDENMPLKNMNPMTIKGNEQYDSLVLFLKQASQIELLKKMKAEDWNIDFTIEAYNKNDRSNKLPLENLKVIEGESYGLKIINSGNVSINIYLIDIQPDYKINVITSAIEIKENSFSFYPLDNVSPPYGMENLVFIATKERIDISPIKELGKEISTRGSSSSPLVDFINTNSSGTRGASSDPGEVTVKSLIFEIKPKQ
jgi:metacaspase-1